jgi:hypothetical protein
MFNLYIDAMVIREWHCWTLDKEPKRDLASKGLQSNIILGEDVSLSLALTTLL